MSLQNTLDTENANNEITEVVRVKLSGEDYLKFNQMIPNLVLAKKMPDSAKKNNVSMLAIKCFSKVMDVVSMGGRAFVQADVDSILATFVKKSSNDEAYTKLVKALTKLKTNEDGSVTLTAQEYEALLETANVSVHKG